MLVDSAKKYAGRQYRYGEQDCYSLLQEFYRELGLELDDMPRPLDWFANAAQHDLFMKNYAGQGFRVVDVAFNQLEVGDMLLCAISCPRANHCAVYVGEGMILHHLAHRLSQVESLSRLIRATTVAILRHPFIKKPEVKYTLINLSDLDPNASLT